MPQPVRLALPDTRHGAYLHAAITRELERVATAPRGASSSAPVAD
ncbi:hypothetical protein ABT061_17335 [Streptosporangium sp. NPDC002544]